MTENVEQTEAVATEQQTAQQSTDLTINDLGALKTVVDVAISRGAFKGNEMVAVGQAYTKLDNFLTAVTEQAKAEQNKEAGTE